MAEARNGTRTAPPSPDILPLFLEQGTTGLKAHGGYVKEEYLRQLQGQRGMKVYREMTDDPVISSILFAIEMLVRQAPWRVEPVLQTPEGLQAAALVDSMLFRDMSQSWPMLMSEILSFLPYGFSFHEAVFKRRLGMEPPREYKRHDPAWAWWAPSQFNDGLLAWRKLPIRSQDTLLRWELDTTGGVQAMVQRDPRGHSVSIPIDKALLFRGTSYKGNPEGRSVLRGAFTPWVAKRHLERIEGIGIERDLAGLPVAYAPVELFGPSLDTNQQAQMTALKDIVTNIRQDEQAGLVFPLAYDSNGHPRYKIELLSTGGAAKYDTDKVIRRYDTRITQVVLADVIMLGHGQTGTQALAVEKDEFFSLGITGFLDAIAETFNRYAIPKVWLLNALPIETMPSLRHGKIRKVDFEKFTLGILRLAQAGIDLTQDVDHIRMEAGFPERAAEELAL